MCYVHMWWLLYAEVHIFGGHIYACVLMYTVHPQPSSMYFSHADYHFSDLYMCMYVQACICVFVYICVLAMACVRCVAHVYMYTYG